MGTILNMLKVATKPATAIAISLALFGLIAINNPTNAAPGTTQVLTPAVAEFAKDPHIIKVHEDQDGHVLAWIDDDPMDGSCDYVLLYECRVIDGVILYRIFAKFTCETGDAIYLEWLNKHLKWEEKQEDNRNV